MKTLSTWQCNAWKINSPSSKPVYNTGSSIVVLAVNKIPEVCTEDAERGVKLSLPKPPKKLSVHLDDALNWCWERATWAQSWLNIILPKSAVFCCFYYSCNHFFAFLFDSHILTRALEPIFLERQSCVRLQ